MTTMAQHTRQAFIAPAAAADEPTRNNSSLPDVCKVFVKGIHASWDRMEVYRLVRSFGVVRRIQLSAYNPEYEYRYGTIEMKQPSAARAIINALQGRTYIELPQVQVQLSNELLCEPFQHNFKAKRVGLKEAYEAQKQQQQMRRQRKPPSHGQVAGQAAVEHFASATYKHESLQLDQTYKVNVSCFNSPADLYVQQCDPRGRLNAIRLQMQSQCKQPLDAYKVGTLCAVADADGELCRAQVIAGGVSADSVYVQLVDFGDRMRVHRALALHVKFAVSLKAQAIHCCIDWPGGSSSWTAAEVEQCHEWLCADAVESITVRPVRQTHSLYTVDLIRKLSSGVSESMAEWLQRVMPERPQHTYTADQMKALMQQALAPPKEIVASEVFVH